MLSDLAVCALAKKNGLVFNAEPFDWHQARLSNFANEASLIGFRRAQGVIAGHLLSLPTEADMRAALADMIPLLEEEVKSED